MIANYISTAAIWILSAVTTYMLWAVTWDWTKDLLRPAKAPSTWANGDPIQAPSLQFPDGTSMQLEPGSTFAPLLYAPEILLYSPKEDGRYKALCTTDDKCLPLEDVMAHINQHGTLRKER